MLELNGTWRLTGIDDTGLRAPIDIEAQVPGHVHQDLQRAGLIDDPLLRDNADRCQWVEHTQWTYKTTFELDALREGFPVLAFEGLDTVAEVYLNGCLLGQTDNMFIRYRFDVAGLLRLGSNDIVVRFAPVPRALADKPYAGYAAAFSNERVYMRRMQCTFGWDWVHRLVSYGIWKPVRLVYESPSTIEDVFAYTRVLDDRGAEIRCHVEVKRRTEAPMRATVTIRDPEGTVVWEANRPVFGDALEVEAHLREPRLWWPSGYGDQPIYTVETTIYGASGGALDTRSSTLGIRTVRFERLIDRPGSPEMSTTERLRREQPQWDRNGDAPGSSFTLIVNGVPVFCKGANWVPVNPFPSRVEERHYEHLLKLARDGHVTLLRCWGGGIFEPEPFWSWCDRLGLLVCQDFLMACGSYPEDDTAWAASLREEASAGIRALRNHPSLVWWNGDNENGIFHDEDDPRYPGRRTAETITGRLCAELDPSRPFTPTSPFGGSPNLSFTTGTSHHTGIMLDMFDYIRANDLRDYRGYFASFLSRFCSEFPMFGTPELHTLLRFVSEADLEDPAYAMLEYHTKNHPGLTDFSLFKVLLLLADKLMPAPPSPGERIRRMSYVQHELTRLVVEAYRRSRYYASGILFWMYNDCWPASGWSLIDYYGYPKGGYYGFKAASKPVIASISHDPDRRAFGFWVCSDSLAVAEGTARLRVLALDADDQLFGAWTRAYAFRVPPGQSLETATISEDELLPLLDARHALVMEIEGEFGADRNVWFSGVPADMALAPSGARIERRNGDSVDVRADRYAKAVHLHGEYVFSDNYFDLLPGESRTIRCRRIDGAPSSDEDAIAIELTCWNP